MVTIEALTAERAKLAATLAQLEANFATAQPAELLNLTQQIDQHTRTLAAIDQRIQQAKLADLDARIVAAQRELDRVQRVRNEAAEKAAAARDIFTPLAGTLVEAIATDEQIEGFLSGQAAATRTRVLDQRAAYAVDLARNDLEQLTEQRKALAAQPIAARANLEHAPIEV